MSRKSHKTSRKSRSSKTKKTRKSRLASVSATVKKLHSYEKGAKFPFFSEIVSLDQLKKKVKEMCNLEFKVSHEPFKVKTFYRKSNIIPDTFLGKPTKLVDEGYLEYDMLSLYFSDKEIFKCSPDIYRTLEENFQLYGDLLKNQYLKEEKRKEVDKPSFREYIWKNVKQCTTFRPTAAMAIYDFFNATSILDPSAGWGDRLFASAITNRKYIGIDPNNNNRSVYDQMITHLGQSSHQRVITSGAEYLPETRLKKEMKDLGIGKFDLIFTSPPFFDYEVYPSRIQSVNHYGQSFEAWLTYFMIYVICKYASYLEDKGHFALYLQDVGGNVYLEPIILYVLSNHADLKLNYVGSITLTKFPMIVFQKDIKSSDNYQYKGRNYNSHDLQGLLKRHYPLVFDHSSKMDKIGWRKFNYEVQINHKLENNNKNLILFDQGLNGSRARYFFKEYLKLPNSVRTIVWYGSKKVSIIVYYVAYFCKLLGKKFVYYTITDEHGYKGDKDRETLFEVKPNSWFRKALQMGMIEKSISPKNRYINTIKFWKKTIQDHYKGDKSVFINNLDFSDDQVSGMEESIREKLMFIPQLNPDTFRKTIFVSVERMIYAVALANIFQKAKIVVLATWIMPQGLKLPENMEVVTLRDLDHYHSHDHRSEEIRKIIKEFNIEPFTGLIYPIFLERRVAGDICVFLT